MALIWANRNRSTYDLSITLTIYSRSRTLAPDNTIFTRTKQRPFSLRNLQGETQDEQVKHAIQIMNEVAKELHYLTGFGIDKGRVKSGSTTIEQVVYPDLIPIGDESLWSSFAIVLGFSPHTYQWVKDGRKTSRIEESELKDGWQKQAVRTGHKSSFKIPAVKKHKKQGFFRWADGRWADGMNQDKSAECMKDMVFTRFISRFREEGNLCYGRSRSFGPLSHVLYDYWPQAKKPQKYRKKLPRKSQLATQPTDDTEYVYIIKVSRQNIYKIGKSNDPQGRVESLQTASPYKLNIVHTFKADNASGAEETLHELLHKNRMEGEWFNIPKPQSNILLSIERFENEQFWIDGERIEPRQLFKENNSDIKK